VIGDRRSVIGALLGAAVLASAASPPGNPHVGPLKQGAIGYYDGACAHCHGPYGSAYGKAFFTHYDLAKLAKTIKEMAEGPGQSPLDPEGLKAQTAFHQAIITGAPFIDWTGRTGATLSGEVTRRSIFTARAKGVAVAVAVSGTQWTLAMPPGTAPGDLTLTAILKGKTTVWRPDKYPYSLPPKWPPGPVK